jgi:ABC-2 type transport system ATP-binding protein
MSGANMPATQSGGDGGSAKAVSPSAKAVAPSPAADGPMIVVDKLTKRYGGIVAVDQIEFSVPRGEILGFLGPNGAGKTTTMRMLTCYSPPTSGTARVGGCDVRKDSIQVRKLIGYLPESAPLYLDMKVRPYLNFMAEIKRYPGNLRRGYVDEALAECGLGDVADRLIGNLSKGYRQRVGLAQALLGDPKVLILDEPTVGLDPAQIQEIRQLICNMRGRRTVILSTHILPEVSMTCQKVIIIHRGRIVAQGTPESLVSTMEGGEVILATVEGAPDAVLATIGKVAGVVAVAQENRLGERSAVYRIETKSGVDPRAALSRALVEAGHGLLEQKSSGMTLEDIFIRVISTQRGEG